MFKNTLGHPQRRAGPTLLLPVTALVCVRWLDEYDSSVDGSECIIVTSDMLIDVGLIVFCTRNNLSTIYVTESRAGSPENATPGVDNTNYKDQIDHERRKLNR